jgi:hypothetical protein
MDIDPLADVPPPRYAIESDDEDEDERLPQTSSLKVEITFKSERHGQEIDKHVPLVVASGQAGSVLARLLDLPLISSRVYANSVEVFFSFSDSPHTLTTHQRSGTLFNCYYPHKEANTQS